MLIIVLGFTTSTPEKWKAAGDDRALTRALVLWTGVLAIATVVGAIVAGVTLKTIQAQLDEMRLDRRPWVSVKAYLGDVNWDEHGMRMSVKFDLKNTGKGPALGVLFQSELSPVIGEFKVKSPFLRLKELSLTETFKRDHKIGFPILPGEVENVVEQLRFSRERIAELNDYLKTFKSPEGKTPEVSPLPFLPIMILYVADYLFDVGGEHHQYYCAANVSQIDQLNPFASGTAIPMDINRHSSQAQTETLPTGVAGQFDCDRLLLLLETRRTTATVELPRSRDRFRPLDRHDSKASTTADCSNFYRMKPSM